MKNDTVCGLTFRSRGQRLLNAVQRPDLYEEVLIPSGRSEIVLSIWKARNGTGTLVFLPGTMTHPLFYEECLNALASGGINVVGVHFRNHGKSPRTPKAYTFGDLVDDAAAAVEHGRARFGPKVAVLGSSQGGIVAAALAARDPTLRAVFAHNILDPELRESLSVTRFPALPRFVYDSFRALMRVGARLLPRLKIPIWFYLQRKRIFGEAWTSELFDADPLTLRAYPLRFLASLFSADMSFLRTGAITCPLVVIGSTGDPLFKASYTQRVFANIAAPQKELLIFRSARHLLLNEDLPTVLSELHLRLEKAFSDAGEAAHLDHA